MSPEESALLQAAIDSEPDNPAPLLVLADWYDDHGESSLAYACRWMAYRGKRPGVSYVGGDPLSQFSPRFWPITDRDDTYHLPEDIMSGRYQPELIDDNREVAYRKCLEWLAGRLQSLIRTSSWPAPG